MKSPKRVRLMEAYIRSIINLDCGNLPKKTAESVHNTSLNRPTMAKVATVALIRSLLTTFEELVQHLNNICKISEMKPYYEYRRSLVDRVINESLFAFEHCHNILKLRGTTNSPIAMKLISLANDVCDRVDLIKEKVNVALEYHEIRYKILGDIQSFAENNLTRSAIEPLMFSLNVVLPVRVEAFIKSATAQFPDDANQLEKMCNAVIANIKHRVGLIKEVKEVKPTVVEHTNSSATRPVKVLRGITCKQRLSGTYQRVTLYHDAPEPQQILNNPELNEHKENIMVNVESVEPLQSENPVKPVDPADLEKKENIITVPKTRIKPPTKIVNKRVPLPAKPVQINPEIKHRQSSTSLSSQIARPTMLTAKPSVSNLRSTSWQAPKVLTQDTPIESTTLDLLSSPDCSMDETPLTRKSGRIGIQRRSHQDTKFTRQHSLLRSIRT